MIIYSSTKSLLNVIARWIISKETVFARKSSPRLVFGKIIQQCRHNFQRNWYNWISEIFFSWTIISSITKWGSHVWISTCQDQQSNFDINILKQYKIHLFESCDLRGLTIHPNRIFKKLFQNQGLPQSVNCWTIEKKWWMKYGKFGLKLSKIFVLSSKKTFNYVIVWRFLLMICFCWKIFWFKKYAFWTLFQFDLLICWYQNYFKKKLFFVKISV